ncbi:TetR/AcrR family transcriptional regulator [Bradyrhizobium iriomotense]|uniref:TetR family transcriptional regulator n=1 Tax=Bradyrhizobium iriomotense TaxID=441950 RepID=A0ABQ6B2B9_9BRAD|nr:TetR/AcrR family transcriptional regulator [Bradyrhizobium iriomotense]GLR86252.1 TetR family transcriptional regulator [Bradyrhizobium iriomotense]
MPAREPPKRRSRAAEARPYHHGDLRRVLIDAALQLAAEGGDVSVREAARRAAVSPGAPFRHFPNRDALMAAVAGEAQRRFRAEIDTALAQTPPAEPLVRLRAFGLAYLRWAMRNPAHFEIISTGRYFAHGSSPELTRDNAELIALTERMLGEAAERGLLRQGELKPIQIAARALVYGFARMNLDGHFPRWGVEEGEIEKMAEAVIDVFIAGIAKPKRGG